MLRKFFWFILPALAVFALLIYLGGNTDLYENFTFTLLTNMSNMEVKNPATDFAEILDSLEDISNSSFSLTHSNNVWDFFSNYFSYMGDCLSIGFVALKVIVLVVYDLVFNLIQFIKLIIDTTGISTMN